MNTNLFNNFNKVTKILLLLILFYIFAFRVFGSYFGFFEMYFNSSIHFDDNLLLVTDNITKLHSDILTSIMLVSLISLVRKKLTLFYFVLAIILSFEFNLYGFIDNYIHPTLFNLGVFSLFTRTGQLEVNPQYTRLLILLINFTFFSALILFKKFRSIDRSFTYIILSASIVVLLLFHMAIPMGILKYTKNQRFAEFSNEVLADNSGAICNKFKCIHAKDTIHYDSPDIRNVDLEINSKLNYITNGNSNFVSGQLGDFIGTKFLFFGCKKNSGDIVCVINDNPMKLYGILSKLWFSFLTSFAHSVWFFGGFFILYLHKARKIKKIT